jgi:O-antigen ligase
LLGTGPASIGLVLLTLTFLVRFRHWPSLARDRVGIWALVFATFVACHSLVFSITAPVPELAEAVADTGMDWLKLLLFVPFAYWAAGIPGRIRLLLFLALLGFTLGTIREIDWSAFDPSFFQRRYDGRLPAIAFGMFSALGALGLLALRRSFWGRLPGGWTGWLRMLAWLSLFAMMLEGLVLSFSRGSWIAFVAALVILFCLEWRDRRRSSRAGARFRTGPSLLIGGLIAVALVLVLGSQLEQITSRVEAEADTISSLVQGDPSQIESGSIGLRVHAWLCAWDLVSERPWFGWGAGTSRHLISHSGRDELRYDEKEWMPHLHNAYVEIAVQFGSLGLLLSSVLVWRLAGSTRRACLGGHLPGDLCRYFAVTLVFVLLWNMTNYRVIHHDWLSFWIIFAGSAYSVRLRALIERGTRDEATASPV